MSSRAALNNLQAVSLVTLRISNGALASAPNLPNRLKLLNWGENSSVKGPVRVGERTAKALSLNQQARGFDRIALDFEHNTVPGSPEYERTKEPRPIAAYGTPRLVPGEGLFMENIEWTPTGKSEAYNYADLSPAVERDDSNEVLFIHSAALTRTGAVNELSFFSAALPAAKANEDQTMKDTILVADLAPLVGLSADAEKTAVVEKFKTLLLAAGAMALLVKDGKLVALSAIEDKLGMVEAAIAKFPKPELLILSAQTGADGKEVKLSTTELVALSTEVKGLKAQLAGLTNATETVEKGKVISLFATDGKVPLGEDGKPMALDALSALTVPELKRLHANTPVTVPLNARGVRPNGGQVDDTLKGAARAGAAWAHMEK